MAGRHVDLVELRNIVDRALELPLPPRSLRQRARDAWQGWFGPGRPPEQSAPAGTPVRAFDWRAQPNIIRQPRATEPVSFAQLRHLSKATLVRSAIETCKDQFDRLTWSIQRRDEEDAEDDPRVVAITEFLHRPDRRYPFKTWLRMLLEDLLVLDAPAVHIRRTRGGAPFALEVVDGATIHPLIDDTGRMPLAGPAYQQIVRGMVAADLEATDLIYAPRNPRSHSVYGFSPVEQLLSIIDIALERERTQLEYFTAGNIPDVMVPVHPDWTVDQIKEAQVYWSQLRGDTASRRGVTLVPGVSGQIHDTRLPPIKDEFDEWLARLVMFIFSLPGTWALKQGMNRATAQVIQDQSVEEGLQPRMLWVSDVIDDVLRVAWGADDLCFKWSEIREPDPKTQAEIAEFDSRAGVRSINECRAERGLPATIGGEEPFIITANGPILVRHIPLLSERATQPPEPPPVLPGSEEPPDDDPGGDGGSVDDTPTDDTSPDGTRSTGRAAALEKATRGQLALSALPAKLRKRLAGGGLNGPPAKRAVRQMTDRLRRAFAAAIPLIADAVMARLERGPMLTKAAIDDLDPDQRQALDDVMARIPTGPLDADDLVEALSVILGPVALTGGRRGKVVLEISMPTRESIILPTERLQDLAKQQAAALVGKRVLLDGRIIPNPRAEYAITETTRDMLRSVLAEAFRDGTTRPALIERLQGDFAFSEARATRIARTEVSNLYLAANLETWRASGVVMGKQSVLSDLHDQDDICDANAAAGVIPIDEAFPSGHQAPTYHPACECDLLPHVIEQAA